VKKGKGDITLSVRGWKTKRRTPPNALRTGKAEKESYDSSLKKSRKRKATGGRKKMLRVEGAAKEKV